MHLSILRARAVPCTQKQVSFSYLFCGKRGCSCGNYNGCIIRSATKCAKEHLKRISRARGTLDCLTTARHTDAQKELGGSASVMERFQQVPLQFSGQVGREEAGSEVRLCIEPFPVRHRPHVCRYTSATIFSLVNGRTLETEISARRHTAQENEPQRATRA